MFGIGHGTLVALAVGAIIGLAAYPAGRAILRTILNRIVGEVGKITHSKVIFTPHPIDVTPVKTTGTPAPAAPAPAAPATPAAG